MEYIIGNITKEIFMDRIEKYAVIAQICIPEIEYDQSFEGTGEQASTVSLGGSTHGILENSVEKGGKWGFVGKGTIGCFISIRNDKVKMGNQERIDTKDR